MMCSRINSRRGSSQRTGEIPITIRAYPCCTSALLSYVREFGMLDARQAIPGMSLWLHNSLRFGVQ